MGVGALHCWCDGVMVLVYDRGCCDGFICDGMGRSGVRVPGWLTGWWFVWTSERRLENEYIEERGKGVWEIEGGTIEYRGEGVVGGTERRQDGFVDPLGGRILSVTGWLFHSGVMHKLRGFMKEVYSGGLTCCTFIIY